MTTGLRACAGVLLAVWCAGASVVSLDAQSPAQKKPAAAAPAKTAPAGTPQQAPATIAPGAANTKAVPAPAPVKTAPGAGGAQAPGAKPTTVQPPAGKTTSPQPSAPKPAAAQPDPQQAPPPPDVERPPAVEAFVYKPEGRRDPFLSLVNRAAVSEKRAAAKKPEGVRGLSWDDITLRGIFQGRKGAVALVQGSDTKTYQLHVGDQLYDAVIRAITADSLVGLQEVNDPLSLQKQRERRKTLRVAEEVK